MSATLNQADFKTVWNENFTDEKSLDRNLFPMQWGDASEFSFGGNGVTIRSDGNSAGFLTRDQGAGESYGYGLYQATVTMPTHQGNGAFIDLWPADNKWPGPEMDLIEQWNGQPYSTVHWNSNGGNDYHSQTFDADLSKPTTVALDWERSGLTFYVNGQQIAHYAAGGSVPVPKDHADGGVNSAFGVGDVGPAGTSLTVSDMSYSSSTGGSAPTPPAPTPPAPTPPAPAPTTPISLSNPGMHFVSDVQAGVTTAVKISDPGLKEAYAVVMTSKNVAEQNWIGIPLDAKGQATYDFHFAHSGDYVLAVGNTSTDAEKGFSAPIVISHS